MAALPHQPASVHLTFGSELRSHPSFMPSLLLGKGVNQQQGCAGRLLKELVAGQLWASKGHRHHGKPTETPHFPLALTAQPFCVPCPAHRAPLPNTTPLHTNTCLQGPWEQLCYLQPGLPWHAGLCRGKSCPSSLGPVLSMHLSHRSLQRAASAPLPHKPPALLLLLPAWVPPPLPPLQQISLKCAAIWFQLSPIFFLVD